MIDITYISEEQATELSSQEFRKDERFYPVQDPFGNWFITAHEQKYSSITWLKDIKQVSVDIEQLKRDKRNLRIEQLKQAAKDFATLITDEDSKAVFLQSIKAFFFDNSEVITDYIINGGDGVRTLFETSEEQWMDMRADEESPSPREYALNLLN